MEKQPLKNKMVTGEMVSLSEKFTNVKPEAIDIKTQQKSSSDGSAVRTQLTFYQPHLCQPPNDYTLLADESMSGSVENYLKQKSSQKLLSTSSTVENLKLDEQNSKFKKRLQSSSCPRCLPELQKLSVKSGGTKESEKFSLILPGMQKLSVKSGGTRESERCTTCERDSNESVIELQVNNQNRLTPPATQIRGNQTQNQKVLEDTKEPLTYIKFFEEGTFIPKKNDASAESKPKPNTIERGYLLWEFQSTGNNVLNLETKMERMIEEQLPKLEKQQIG